MSKSELDRIRAVYTERQAARTARRYGRESPAEVYGLERRRDAFRSLLTRWLPDGPAGRSVLDVGCGRGGRLAEWTAWGGDPERLVGVDLMPDLVDQARQAYPASRWLVASGDALPFADGSFDVVTQSMAVSSILDPEMRVGVARDMWRVLKPGGLLLWYDFHYPNPWNPNVRPVRRRELSALFPVPPKDVFTLTLIPPLARRIAPRSVRLCRLLEHVPWLRSHHVALFKKEH